MLPRWTSTAPIGMPRSASPRCASSMAASRKGSLIGHLSAQPYERHGFRSSTHGRYRVMLHMALVFLVIGIVAALLGFTTIAGASIAIAKFLAGLFLLLFLVFLIIGIPAARRVVD